MSSYNERVKETEKYLPPLQKRCLAMLETDGFKLVTHRKNYRRRNLNQDANTRSVTSGQITEDCEVDIEDFLRELDNVLVRVRDTSFTKLVLSQLTKSLIILNSNGISEIICYGLGQFFGKRNPPRYQLALLLCIKAQHDVPVHVYDPTFRSKEVQALRTLGLQIIETNEEGKRLVERDKTTLVFMPHCAKQLTNNFLYANWGDRLSNCILFANSFSRIIDDCLSKDILNKAGYILRIQPYVTEIQLENSFECEEAFNDLNIHIFTKSDLLNVPSNFWYSREKPQYTKGDCEFVTANK